MRHQFQPLISVYQSGVKCIRVWVNAGLQVVYSLYDTEATIPRTVLVRRIVRECKGEGVARDLADEHLTLVILSWC